LSGKIAMKKKKCDLIKNHTQIYYLFKSKPIKNKLFFKKFDFKHYFKYCEIF